MTKRITGVHRSPLLRRFNASAIFANIFHDGPITQREISRAVGLSFASVTSVVSALEKKGLIQRSVESSTNGGRPAALYKCNSTYRYVMGIEARKDELFFVVSDLEGRVLSQSTTPFDKKIGRDGFLDLLLRGANDQISNFKGRETKFLGIGIGVAGLVNPEDGSVTILSHLSNWGNIPLKQILEEKLRLRVVVHNLAAAAALGESWYGLGRGKKNFLFLSVTDGVGGGIVINGQLYTGTAGSAGEFGHITVDDHGPVCTCGNVGCLETLISIPSIIQSAKNLLADGVSSAIRDIAGGDLDTITFSTLVEAAKREDKLAYKLFTDVARYLGEGIVSLVNLLNPEMIVIGGDLVQAGNLILDSVNDVLKRQALEVARKSVEIVFSELGGSACALGSVVPLIEEFVASPMLD
ncbi:MAG: ROK family transcriptional regulator [Bacteroidetes bacterium]|nr:ROK family transcriptional regulator [Bacteroidota bacterium]